MCVGVSRGHVVAAAGRAVLPGWGQRRGPSGVDQPAGHSLGCARPAPAQVSVAVLAKGAAGESGVHGVPASPRLGRGGRTVPEGPHSVSSCVDVEESGWAGSGSGSPQRVRDEAAAVQVQIKELWGTMKVVWGSSAPSTGEERS